MWRIASRSRALLLRHPVRLIFLGLVAVRCFSCIPEDEFQCEDAAARLKSCCGQSAVHRCVYERTRTTTGGGCSGQPLVVTDRYVTPEMMGRDAVCLAQRTCDEVRAAGACEVRSWLLAEACHPSSMTPSASYYSCTSPGQESICENARPDSACRSLRSLRCR